MRLFKDASYKFIEARRKAYVVSAAVLLLGAAAMVFNVATLGQWQSYGVDFTGGSLIQVRFDVPTDVGVLRDALGGAQAPPITRFGEENEFVIRAPIAEDASITLVAARFLPDFVSSPAASAAATVSDGASLCASRARPSAAASSPSP